MKIEHIAIWVHDLEKVKEFYIKYFEMKCGEKYTNTKKNFSSCFLSFEGSSTRIEIMHKPGITDLGGEHSISFGLTHFSISVGSKGKVDKLTEQLRIDGYKIVGEPRTTGDGFYESVIEDSEGNWVEITE
ncbi:VOC family protein [Labilibaculum manganireducens]|uniref:VOC family protein n=1 Tax=Labilibaculum manganireducens TaxID=1940525 RepID=UPI0029F500E1|nr:VOC family protein [Labilibaculum manganireducens]